MLYRYCATTKGGRTSWNSSLEEGEEQRGAAGFVLAARLRLAACRRRPIARGSVECACAATRGPLTSPPAPRRMPYNKQHSTRDARALPHSSIGTAGSTRVGEDGTLASAPRGRAARRDRTQTMGQPDIKPHASASPCSHIDHRQRCHSHTKGGVTRAHAHTRGRDSCTRPRSQKLATSPDTTITNPRPLSSSTPTRHKRRLVLSSRGRRARRALTSRGREAP